MDSRRIAKVSAEVVKSVNNSVCRLSKMDANNLKIWYMLSSHYHLDRVKNRVITLSLSYMYEFLDLTTNRKRSVIMTDILNSISESGFVQLIEDESGDTTYKVAPFASYVEYSFKTGVVTIKINEEAEVFLKTTQFAKVYLKRIKALKTTEEIILYTLFQLRKGMNGGIFNIKLDELKLITNCTTASYIGKSGNYLFLKKVLGVEKSINELDEFYNIKPFDRTKDAGALSAINALTELEVRCRPLRGYKGKITTLEFTIIDHEEKPAIGSFETMYNDSMPSISSNTNVDADMNNFRKSNAEEPIINASERVAAMIEPIVTGEYKKEPKMKLVTLKSIEEESRQTNTPRMELISELLKAGYKFYETLGQYIKYEE